MCLFSRKHRGAYGRAGEEPQVGRRQAQRLRFSVLQRENVVDEANERIGFRRENFDAFARGRRQAAERIGSQKFDIALDECEWRAQLMRDVLNEFRFEPIQFPQLVVRLFQPLGALFQILI